VYDTFLISVFKGIQLSNWRELNNCIKTAQLKMTR